jgi:hypothetical protein
MQWPCEKGKRKKRELIETKIPTIHILIDYRYAINGFLLACSLLTDADKLVFAVPMYRPC